MITSKFKTWTEIYVIYMQIRILFKYCRVARKFPVKKETSSSSSENPMPVSYGKIILLKYPQQLKSFRHPLHIFSYSIKVHSCIFLQILFIVLTLEKNPWIITDRFNSFIKYETRFLSKTFQKIIRYAIIHITD